MVINDIELCNTPGGVIMVYPKDKDPYILRISDYDIVSELEDYINHHYHDAYLALSRLYSKSSANPSFLRYRIVSRFIRCNLGELDTNEVDVSGGIMHLEEVVCPLRGTGDCLLENIVCKPQFTLPLTKQQKKVYKLYSEGLKTENIAEMLCLSPATIDRHRKDIQQKLSLHSLADMIAYYHRNHLNF